jgi:DNA repair protein RadA/Sms
MMAKSRTVYVCQACGAQSPKWIGRCPDCGEWNSMVEEPEVSPSLTTMEKVKAGSHTVPLPITEIESGQDFRFSSSVRELDRVLGGGIVPGSVVLIGGDPGIGKSTILLQMTGGLSQVGLKTLYVSGEESARQTRLRGDRLGILHPNLYVLTETCLEDILKQVDTLKPDVLVIDSIQTMYTSALQSSQGSVSQVREVAAQLMLFSKQTNISTFIVGHVTKTGSIAGPKVLEHIVDTVLYFEGERQHIYRILRSVKNRFGSTNEIGVFEMKTSGLEEVNNPSAMFLSERPAEQIAGSAVTCSMEGTRPILIELQALVTPTNLGTSRRMTKGVDANRIALLIAVLEKVVGLFLQSQDVFVNVVGGVKIDEPAVDLGLALAMASSFKNLPLDHHAVVFGEVGLGGEIRTVPYVEQRLREAEKLGFTRSILPAYSQKHLPSDFSIETIGISSLADAIEAVFQS